MKNKSIKNTFKNTMTHEINVKDTVEIFSIINEKILHIQKIIRNTILSNQQYKLFSIFSNNDLEICITSLTEIYLKSCSLVEENQTILNEKTKNVDSIIQSLQELIDKLIIIMSGFGTKTIEDILFIVFGSDYKDQPTDNKIFENKYSLIKTYLHPIGFKIIPWKNDKKYKSNQTQNKTLIYCQNKWSEENKLIHYYNNYECFDIDYNEKTFYYKIHGVQTIIKNEKLQKTIIINCLSDDILLDFFSNSPSSYIDVRKKNILENIPKNDSYDPEIMKRLIDSLTLKEILIYGNDDIYKNYLSIINDVQLLKTNKLDITIKNFLEIDLLFQRKYLMNLLIYDKEHDIHYIAYLLYDLLTIQANDALESVQQRILYDSFPYKIKQYLKDTMNITMKYTQEMISKYDISKISLEQQVYLFKAPENVKEKAIMKMKEIKSKSDETSTKTKQYLEGLLKIPFQIYKKEPILKINKTNNQKFINLLNQHKEIFDSILIEKKECYTKIEINQTIQKMEKVLFEFFFKDILERMTNSNNKIITNCIYFFEELEPFLIEQLPQENHDTLKSTLEELLKTTTKQKRIPVLSLFIEIIYKIKNNLNLLIQLYKIYEIFETPFSKIPLEIKEILNNNKELNRNLDSITNTLDESIYGHSHAKNQILKIISQWMTGEHNGYCFGFEGSPGIGKTSLAKKGLSNCLVDENGVTRPFSFIALGGSCNGSTLEGHSYTYVNSSWGRIVDILMDTKCMNPIIYIDELDKVSKTEHGREIIGILTHLIDSTQNDVFQDKYFSGIDIDLSKVLFIFSYNDPEQIDKVLLDRIHRIKFDNISLNEKIVIVEKYILPEINKKMGFHNTVVLSNEIIEYIIEHYTSEPGVRKLKEVLFDLFGEINIQILKDENILEIPIILSIESIETRYLKKYKKIEDKQIHIHNKIGIINGLWANSLGKGGIIPIEAVYFPSSIFLDFKLTGLQGDVMKESMNVAKSLAWSLCEKHVKQELIETFESTKCQGIHIHCPEGSISKDGPSAGSAITVAIYSLLNNKRIKNNIAITGEINLQGDITVIGGLDLKIMGGIRSGIKTFIYPKENQTDLDEFMKKQIQSLTIFENISFISVQHIQDVFEYVFE
jgi:ATP-dependent Lon protease